MRFEQLKKDPNNIMRKKLVKSKKGWMVLASLALAGGLFWLSGPSYTVKADVAVTPAASVQTAGKDAGDSRPIAVAPKTIAATDKEQPIVKPTLSNDKNIVNDNSIKISAKQTNVVTKKAPVITTTAVSKNTTSATKVPIVASVPTNSRVPEIKTAATIDTSIKTDKKDNSLTKTPTESTEKEQVDQPKAFVTAVSATISKDSDVIASGTQGSAPWKINHENELHIGDANKLTAFTNNTATTANKVSSADSNDDNAVTKASPTSPWGNYANDINTISFDGKVNAAPDMNHMFANLKNLTAIENIDNLNTAKGGAETSNMTGLFMNDDKLKSISNNSNITSDTVDLSTLNLSSVTSTDNMFLNDSSIQSIKFSSDKNTTLRQIKSLNYMFKNDVSLNSVIIENWQFRNAESMLGMFQNDTKLSSLELNSWNMNPKVDTGDSSENKGMFDGTNLTSIDLSRFNRFRNYTMLPSSRANSWTDGNHILSTLPGNNDLGALFDGNKLATSNFHENALLTFKPNASDKVTTVHAKLTILTNMGTQTSEDFTGPINSAISYNVKQIPGYTPDFPTVIGTILGNGKAVTNYYVTYTGDPVPKYTATINLPGGKSQTISGTTNDDGEPVRIGDTISLDVPKVAGYDTPKVTGTVNPDKTVTFATQPTYKPTTYTKDIKVDTNKGIQTVQIISPAGNASGTLTKVIPGYSLANNKVNVLVAPDGTVTVDPNQSFNYIGDLVKTPTVSFTTPNTKEEVLVNDSNQKDTSSVRVGDKVTVQIPKVAGYTTQDSAGKTISEINGSIAVDGSFIPDPTKSTDIIYIGNNATPTISFNLPDNKTKVGSFYKTNDSNKTIVPNVQVGDKITIKIPQVPGYTTHDTKKTSADNSVSEIFGTIDSKGDFVADKNSTQLNNIKYIGDSKTPVIPFNTPGKPTDGSFYEKSDTAHKYITQAKVGDKIIIDVPQTAGYDAQDSAGNIIPKISGTIDSKGDFIADTSSIDPNGITYVGKTANPDVSFNIPNGKKQSGKYYKTIDKKKNIINQAHVGDQITIKVPEVDGYYAQDSNKNKITEITGHITTDGQFVSDSTSQQLANIKYIGKDATPTFSFKTHENDNAKGAFYIPDDSTKAPITQAKVGDKLILKLPESKGYHFEDSNGNTIAEIAGHINTDGKFESDKDSPQLNDIKYIGDTVRPTISFTTIGKNQVNGKFFKTNDPKRQITDSVRVGDNITVNLPPVPGYSAQDANKKTLTTITGTIGKDGKFQPDSTKSTDIKYVGNHFTNGTATVDGKKIFNIEGTVGDTETNIYATPVTGYTPVNSSIKGTMQPDGTVSTNEHFNYQPDALTNKSITVTTVKNEQATVSGLTGTVDLKGGVTIPAPTVQGYTPQNSSITGTMQPDGTVIIDPNQSFNYKPNTVKDISIKVNTIKNNQVTVSGLTGTVDLKGGVNIPAPTVQGYTPQNPSIKGTMQPDGTVIIDPNQSFDYKPNTIKNISIKVNTIKKHQVIVRGLTGTVDLKDGVNIPAPTVQGYIPQNSSIKGTMQPDGTVKIDSDQSFNYQPIKISTAKLSFKVNGVSHTIQNISGTVDDKNGIKINAPKIPGYTPANSFITATMQPDGTVIIDHNQSFDYKPQTFDKSKLAFKVNGVTHTIQNISGTVDDINGIKIKAPEITGYTATNKSITATMKPDGTISTDQSFDYRPDNLSNKQLTIDTPNGKITLNDISGTVNDTNGITISAPKVQGYTSTNPTITATMQPDGTVLTNQSFDYQPNTIENGTITIDTPNGKKTLTNLTGKVGSSIEVKVPNIPDYTVNVNTVQATINPDGTLTTTDKIIYTRIPSHSNNLPIPQQPIETTHQAPEKLAQTISTYSDQPDVQIYTLGANDSMSPVTDQDLAKKTNWQSDQKIIIGDDTYYRVATNEWVKANKVYPYHENTMDIRTYDGSDKELFKAEDDLIKSRDVAADSSWFSDRIVELNGVKYYRVATNELVRASDAYIYQPLKQVIKTHESSTGIPLYTAKGILIKNRYLASKSAWLSDSIVYISGIEYYRVATNEFVRASDVDINH